ncbi:EamA family transporter [Solitalea koreensis]|uniref:Permease of the drug/metabolite transporter (DMT) superfamily n=1 Tax=Solitalea koreensis TaxID=543615 RepID=A0A521BYH6_9SPHI|nr:EamA family transporter [Solitalea koreensis]SMO52105.1 Permease of the drug/metabolite transporter (DMT) superfamily [Solitalea koreensis]
MNEGAAPNKWLIALAFAAIYLIWGSTYLAILIALKSITPFLMACMRFFIAGVFLSAWCILKKEKAPSIKSIQKNAISGVLMLSIGSGSVIWAEQYLPSGTTAIIVATLPFWFILLDKKQWANYFSDKLIILGVLLGFGGVILLFGGIGATKQHISEREMMQIISVFVLVGAGIAWVFGSLYAKYKPTTDSTMINVSIQLLVSGVFSLLASLIAGELSIFSFKSVTHDAWLALLYLAIMGSLVAYISYVWLITVCPPVQVGTYAYVNPVIAVVLGGLFANEPFTLKQILALGVILIGVLFVNLPKYKTL